MWEFLDDRDESFKFFTIILTQNFLFIMVLKWINARIEAYEDLQIISFTNQSFAVLYFSGISGYEQSCKILTNWLCENGIDRDGDPFAVYDASDSYENPSMKLFCPVKNVRI